MPWFEEYRNCGCVSEDTVKKSDLLGYCPTHGTDRAKAYWVPTGMTEMLCVRVTPKMREDVMERAERSGLTVANWVRMQLAEKERVPDDRRDWDYADMIEDEK